MALACLRQMHNGRHNIVIQRNTQALGGVPRHVYKPADWTVRGVLNGLHFRVPRQKSPGIPA